MVRYVLALPSLQLGRPRIDLSPCNLPHREASWRTIQGLRVVTFLRWLTTSKAERILEDEVINLRLENMELKAECKRLRETVAPRLQVIEKQATSSSQTERKFRTFRFRRSFLGQRPKLEEKFRSKEKHAEQLAAGIEAVELGIERNSDAPR